MKRGIGTGILILAVTTGLAACAAGDSIDDSAYEDAPPHLNPTLPLEERVEYLLSQLTLDEKAALMGTTAPAIERLDVPEMWGWNQSLHGVVWNQPTTMFPVNIGMAATWNTALIQEVSSVIHDEARAIYNLLRATSGTFEEGRGRQCCLVTDDGRRLRLSGVVFRSPVINISRQPLWGRIHEAFGEDPHLTSRFTVAYVRGMQGDHPTYLKTVSTLKHYAMNNQEERRHYLDAQVPERWMHEYYLPHFKAGIVEAGAQSIMSVYNKLNGVPGAANSWLMTEMLVDRWGFEGYRVPDSGAIGRLVETHAVVETPAEAAATALLAGHDLDEGGIFPEHIPAAVEQGLVSEEDVDGALRRVLRARFKLGEFDPPELVPYNEISPDIIGSPEHRELALRTARESIVLLRNQNDLLPFDRNQIRSIAVIGPHADTAMMGIGYTGQAADFVKPLDGIRNELNGSGIEVLYARGSDILESDVDAEPGFAEAVDVAGRADVAVVFVGTHREIEREGRDRTFLNLQPIQQDLVRRVADANPNTAVVMVNAGPLSLTGGQPSMEPPPAVLMMFMAGEEGGNAVADILFGDYNPAGRLPYTVYYSHEDVPGWEEYDISKGYTYMYFDGQPEWPFGHGLSYTTFEYGDLETSTSSLPGDGEITVSVDVRNTGDVAGDEVVQLYVRDVQPAVIRPRKQLRGFERISLNPGETRTVTLSLSAEDLAYYDVDQGAFVVQPGPFEVMAGSSSENVRGTATIQVTTSGRWDP